MTTHFPQKLYNQLFISLPYIWLTYSASSHVWSAKNNNVTQCVESERQALLKFKQGIRVDHCGLLDSWVEDDRDCCKWRGIHCNRHSGHVTSLSVPGIPIPNNVFLLFDYDVCLEGTISTTLTKLNHLKYLDLSSNSFTDQFPKFIGSLANLVHLNLSNSGLKGVIPQEIGNLTRLSSLDLNDNLNDNPEHYYGLRAESLHWLSRLTLLRYLDLSHIDMSMVSNTWLPIVNSLPLLEVLHLDFCELSLELPHSLSYDNSSSTLKVVSLSWNNINDTSVFKWLFNLTRVETNLVHVDLSFNYQMFGKNIQADEHALRFLGNLSSLQHLDLGSTELNYNFSEIIQLLVACPNNKLKYLDLRSNKVWGSIPENIDTLSSLTELRVRYNQLNGTIPPSLWRLSMLKHLALYSNSLNGVVTSDHLSNLSHLSWLGLGKNKDLVVNISANWIPPFQLDLLELSSCKVGPEFPMWLSTQIKMTFIDLSNTSISSTVPVSFFESLSSNLEYLYMSNNMMYGVIPDVSPITFEFSPTIIDLSSNNFTGAIPRFLRNVWALNLRNNKFSQGLVPLLCPQTKMPLTFLDLSNNSFSDKLPDCWGYLNQLEYLNLKNNKLQGNLPASLGELDELGILQLSNNNISGELPTSLAKCTSLFVLDLADNSLTGYIPSTFGHSLKYLTILNLQNNYFVGTIPLSLCYLSQLQIITISNNHFHGTIPKCIYNLKGMATREDHLVDINPLSTYDDVNALLLMWKGKEQIFDSDHSLGLLKSIDFSNNMLGGNIPEGISNLVGLKSINLSRNNLCGAIPLKIGQLTSLETLDLSHNHLSGEIPTSLAQVSSLDDLDFSYNNLSGEIPTGTQLQSFNASFYAGNPRLCRAPLPACQKNRAPATSMSQNGDGISREKVHDIDDFMLGLYISVVLGFIVGFWGVCGSLALKTSWRHAFFQFFDDLKDRIYVTVVVSIARVWRRS